MVVSVADGRQMTSQMYYPTFTWEIQGQTFSYPMRTLTLGGCHIVLGGDWLRHYSPLEYDYNVMTVTVSKNGKKWGFKALAHKAELHLISARNMSKLVNKDDYGFVGQLCSLTATFPLQDKSHSSHGTVLDDLLTDFSDLFQEHQGLPPHRSIEHLIVLKPDAIPRKMHPYRYPNSLTIKHSFPIPVIDELLDELHGACYFSKIDLREGVSTDPSKIECMKTWPQPKIVKELRGVLGLTGYYRKFIKGYGIISKPLTELLRNDNFKWNDNATVAFEKLKQAITGAPVLALPDFTKIFVIEADACDKGVGAILMQEHQPIAYLSKALSPRNLGLSAYEKEFLAILQAVKKWKHYLVGHHFIIRTDHQTLKHILEQKVDTALQQKWISKLLGLDYEVQYKNWRENKAADALSRREQADCYTITVIIPNWVIDIQRSYEQDEELLPIIQAKTIKNTAYPEFELQRGILKKNRKICVGKSTELRTKIISQLHDSTIGGHSGINDTYQRVKSMFYWSLMKSDVGGCKIAMSEHMPYAGLLQSLPIPTQAWASISMDFIEGLPKSKGKDCIKPEGEEYLQERNKLLEILRQNLTEAQNCMKIYVDKHRTERSFVVGDYVYLKLQPYRQSSLQLRRNLKLAPKYYGPFRVIEKIGGLLIS
ncbi:UNVERIFIED_CONTAM: Retrovirus-related Pol polyprotein from transposon.6 [Sesamum latifolium]|uniref:Retrovirus-related Pol polyprotein from transposon.6 n=1 Tax=Sesamum latifolium TaxID=2727402 RepID=A0AAW2WW33_9LAMI